MNETNRPPRQHRHRRGFRSYKLDEYVKELEHMNYEKIVFLIY